MIRTPTIKMETMKMITHLVCRRCLDDLAEWGVPFGITLIKSDMIAGYADHDIHIYQARPLGTLKCEYSDHIYLANAIDRIGHPLRRSI